MNKEEIKLNVRNEQEIKAYIDGYNACNKQFRECLKKDRAVMNALAMMDVFVAAVNGAVERGD